MDKFSSTVWMLAAFALCISNTDGAITSWDLDASGSPTMTVDASFSKSIVETTDAVEVLFKVTATTGATSVNAYAIGTETNSGQFEVSATGEVTLITSKVLDCATDSTLTVEVEATDNLSSVGTATVVISVTVVNVNTPSFSAPSSSTTLVSLDDNSAAGTAVYTVVATDADCPVNTIMYSIKPPGTPNSDFAIDSSSGAITVANALDRSVTCTYDLVICATDSGTSPGANSASVTVVVVVCDFNASEKHCCCDATTNECSGAGTIFVSSLTVLVLLLFYVYQLA